jgi:hypothetical protein
VGEYPPLPALLTNYDAHTAGMTFDNPGPIYQRLRIGTHVTVNPASGPSMVYPLSQVNRGLQRLLACTMREMGFANYGSQAVGDPFGAGIPAPAADGTTQAINHGVSSTTQFQPVEPAALTDLANTLLTRAGIANARILDDTERKKMAPGFPLFWTDSERSGGGLVEYQFSEQHAPMSLVVGMAGTLTLFNDGAACQGIFDSRIEDLTGKTGFPVRRIHTICRRSNPKNAYVIDYIILAPDENRLIKLAVAQKGLDGGAADSRLSHSDALLTSALQTLKGAVSQ